MKLYHRAEYDDAYYPKAAVRLLDGALNQCKVTDHSDVNASIQDGMQSRHLSLRKDITGVGR